MDSANLEERVSQLERLVTQFLNQSAISRQHGDWRSAIGMFANDPVMKEIDIEGRRIREEDRKRAQS